MAKKASPKVSHHKSTDASIKLPAVKTMGLKRKHFGIAAVIVALLLIIAITALVKGNKDPVLATVNGEPISQSEVTVLRSFLSKDITATDEQLVNDTLIPQKLLMQEAAKRGITVSETELDAYISDTLTKSGLTQDSLEENLKSAGITLQQFTEFVRIQMTIEALKRDLFENAGLTVSDVEAKAFYDANRKQIPPDMDFATAAPLIADFIAKQKQDQYVLQFVDELRSQATITFR